MNWTELQVPAAALWHGEAHRDAPCLFVGADESGPDGSRAVLPPCPVIAVGEGDSATAMAADLVVRHGDAAQALLESIAATPRTAAVIVDLLRLLPDLSVEQGLVAESLAYGLLQGGEEHAQWADSHRIAEVSSRQDGAVELSRQGNCLSIAMDRARADNAIDRPMRDALSEAFELATLDPEITRVVLTGKGRSFSLGADLSEFGTTRDPVEAHHIRRRTLPAIWAARCADKLEVHVHGACVGAGLEIAAFATRLTAGPRAWFHLPEMAMGLLPGAGGCVSLTRRIGRQKTAQLILSGKRMSAREALEFGLIDAVVNDPPVNQSDNNLG